MPLPVSLTTAIRWLASGCAAKPAAISRAVTGRVSGTGMAMGRRPASLARRQIRSAYCPFIGTRKAPPTGTKVRIAASTMKWPEPCSGRVT